jgi:hypothetical protein
MFNALSDGYVITLSGLEAAVKAAVKPKDKVNVCVYVSG